MSVTNAERAGSSRTKSASSAAVSAPNVRMRIRALPVTRRKAHSTKKQASVSVTKAQIGSRILTTPKNASVLAITSVLTEHASPAVI